ncbi:protein arginine N-methyltransferase 7 isoform X2 [Tribolium castaneum]|uniref:Protein arginine N-methyltransferase n=2 Tax=Tribolium castaneum TaxID=7070 RepID=D6WGQ7_TRICA|nr:PREDICTED: protein arginine N-methyltransferase 7 isoform X2 [Tribolium castaneum]EEZ99615.1 Protein arginine N-methyltransferase 7-like Protein [Tribolium castaneum]|eukprot:XP_008193899.1 PREDICTED: protein arginine N-methyltransferase 7 isoform X2 [Tribolium castaneum]
MSIFIQKLNPMTGVNDWIVQQEDYDYHQEVARSSFADMLHDTERNKKYETALKSAIEVMHSRGKKANVLDIGTGTGLLSMMAVRHGADSVTACEAFKPMSECAFKVIKRNGFENKIKIIPKRSTDITVGPGGDLGAPCNILVTEVFDTELIGEGALSTFSHAHKVLLEKDCIVVPQSATVYAQVVESPFIQSWNRVKDVYDNEGKLLIKTPSSVRNCAGSAAVHDLQLSQIKPNCLKFLTQPIPVFRFDWSGNTPFIFDQSTIHSIKAAQSGVAQVVFMWWDLQMDTEGKIVLSCAPHWGPPQEAVPWRDHWMQAIYYLPNEVVVSKDAELHLVSCHDEFSLWFNVRLDLRLSEVDYVKPICECGLHMTFSRTRIGQINDASRNKKYISLLEKCIDRDSVILILSDGFYLSLCASKMGAKKIYYVETNYLSRKILIDFVEFNEITNVEVFENIESLVNNGNPEKINMVVGEPYFLNSILPWDNLLFIYLLKGVRNILTNDARLFPKIAVIKGIAVKFSDLNKIRLPLGECEGFVMKDFDELIETSSNISDDNVEAQPLWEYPGIALSKPVDIITIDSNSVPEKVVELSGVFEIDSRHGSCNGIALWIEWLHEEGAKSVISSGPVIPPQVGQQIEWDVHTRQGVCLFADRATSHISYRFKFDFNEGNITFKWE